MKGGGKFDLRESLRLADAILTTPAVSLMLGTENDKDSLLLDLPPLISRNENALTPDAPALRVMATLYLQAELEQAGVIAVAEVLSEARYELSIRGVPTARRLEDFFRLKREWLDRSARENVFARVFGFGFSVKSANGAFFNRDFQTKFANFCLALRRVGEDLRFAQNVSPMIETAARQTALELLVNLGAHRFGDIFAAAQRIQNQLSKSIELLSDEEIGNVFQTRGMWNVLNAALAPNTPDFARLTTRGQSGMRLLDYLAGKLPELTDKTFRKPFIEKLSPVVNWAEMWLEATGFGLRQTALRRSA